ncbi:MAG TPA: TadE/TadG family type IV pilus assembly protein [Gemmataceae bacterium]|nr:TadE/TadG family type IV pilus assembly protein [Gemmataceae bacterium]
MIAKHRSMAANASRRKGTILPLLVMTITVLIGFLALAIDIGMLVMAKSQAQNAADVASLTAARTLVGDPSVNYNQSLATSNAQAILTYNNILGVKVGSAQLTMTYGTYDYSQTTQTFAANFPPTSGHPVTVAWATVTATNAAAFSKVWGLNFLPTVTAQAQAVHRPRDIALVMDLSGSMRMGTCLGYDFYTSSRTSNNPDSLFPTFSHYSATASAAMQGPSSARTSAYDNYNISQSNTTVGNASYVKKYVDNFYSNAAFAATLIRAFDSYTSTDGGLTWTAPSGGATPVLPPTSYASVPGGDVPLFKNGSSTLYATNVNDVVAGTGRNASWELDGYSNYTNGSVSNAASGQTSYASAPFYGETQGPGYYGKSFFIWPPDPRKPLTTASNSTQIKQFLTDFGYTSTDFSGLVTGPPLSGIYNVTATPGSHAWPWPNDSGLSLSTYLLTRVFIPGGTRLLLPTDQQYRRIMRLYNWNYVIDNVGTTPCDWRVRFFGTNDDTKLFNSSGSLNLPGGTTYTINYNEILRWITQTPNPFPSQLRAGRVKYYSAIPTSITGTWPNYGSTDQRFWKEFIDYTLGLRQTSSTGYQDVSAMAGYGSDFTWGTKSTSTPPSATQYISYTDNPLRPKLRFWFGPMNMVDYLHNYNIFCNVGGVFMLQPGDSYEAPLYSGKEAYLAAVDTMEMNHPNDWFTQICFSHPRSSSSSSGRFNCVRCPMATNYPYAKAALTFPFGTINADGSCNSTEITPYTADPATGSIPSADFMDTPRGDGDTCFDMALMLAYNQFAVTPASDTALRTFTTSSPITFPTGMAGGQGRKGAQKVIIFETDGLPNTSASATLQTNGSYKYYKIRYDMNNPSASEFPSVTFSTNNNATVVSNVYALVQQLATDYSTQRNPFRLYAIGFGPVFSGADASAALTTLQGMQYKAGTQSSASTPLPSNQIITGTDATMSANMVAAFTDILNNGVQIALIK